MLDLDHCHHSLHSLVAVAWEHPRVADQWLGSWTGSWRSQLVMDSAWVWVREMVLVVVILTVSLLALHSQVYHLHC